MAKRTRQQKNLNTIITNIVYYCYDQGVWHSMVFHTLVLTILAIIGDTQHHVKPVAIQMVFSEDSIEDIDMGSIDISPMLTSITETIDHSLSKTTQHTIEEDIPDAENETIQVLSPEFQTYTVQKSVTINDLLTEIQNTNRPEIAQDTHSSNTDNANDVINDIRSALGNSADYSQRTNNRVASKSTGDNISERLRGYGAQTGDVQISIAWNTVDDIDLHVAYNPGNGLIDNINWTNRISYFSKGMLDIDMNADNHSLSNTPVENIFWPPKSSPKGFFVVYVHFFRSWTGNSNVPVNIRIKYNQQIINLKIMAILHSAPQEVHRFRF